ncbi:MAG: SUMF1/EgtB/PvdO family nonheme iron enzyme [Planctomycetota bacterium]
MTVSIDKAKNIIWQKYIEGGKVDDEPSTEELLACFEEYYSSRAPEKDKESFFYGILLFEHAFEEEDDEAQNAYLRQAKRILDGYLALTGESDWEEINDRVEDIDDYFEERGELDEVRAEVRAALGGGAPGTPSADPRFVNMVSVPGGTFLFGTKKKERYLGPFKIDLHPVTNEQYAAFLEATGHPEPAFWQDARHNRPQQPVVGVSYEDCLAYAKWAGKELPTEEQWEKAARGDDGRRYPWGPRFDRTRVNYNSEDLDDVASHPKNESPFGALDMAGGVWEWTSSDYEINYQAKVLRGGCFADTHDFLSCESRLYTRPDDRIDNVGFRCCTTEQIPAGA